MPEDAVRKDIDFWLHPDWHICIEYEREETEVIRERIERLRERMREYGIDAVLVPTDDFHSSEYVGDYYKCRMFITGFTGSAGTALIFMDEAGLWTDGRYYIQAEAELKETPVSLFRAGETGVPSFEDYLAGKLSNGGTLAYDGRTVTALLAKKLEKRLSPLGVRFREDLDLVGEIWTDRPGPDPQPVWELETEMAGRSRAEKIAQVREEMKKKRADVLLMTSLDDIAWLLNLRGNDIHCCPVFLSYLAMTGEEVRLFAWEEAFSPEIRSRLEKDGVRLLPYDGVYGYAASLKAGCRVMLCEGRTNSLLVHSLGQEVMVLDEQLPTTLPKACKNGTEAENMRKAHIRDGVAVTRFIRWLKQNVGRIPVTEMTAAAKLYELRSAQESFLGNSFDPIIAYGEHAAICHYSPSEKTDMVLQAHGFVLADTGGQYLTGTTDITRTIALGELSMEEKMYYTAVLAGHLDLAAACFRSGTTGANLDILARGPLWRMGADYDHGTGHGVGCLLNVHEGPQRIHWRITPGNGADTPFREGMVISDEPGYYAEGRFGIRLENLLLCCKREASVPEEHAPAKREAPVPMLGFEILTVVPFDREAVLPGQLTDAQRSFLNAYHERVRETLSPYLNEEETDWLAAATAPIE